MEKLSFFFIIHACFSGWLWSYSSAQDMALPYFNIALKKRVTVNATCGENIARKEQFCKLVGYDSIYLASSSLNIQQGQVSRGCENVKQILPKVPIPRLREFDANSSADICSINKPLF